MRPGPWRCPRRGASTIPGSPALPLASTPSIGTSFPLPVQTAPQPALLPRQHAAWSRHPFAKSVLGGPMDPIRDRRYTSERLRQGIHGLRHLFTRRSKGAAGNEAPRSEFPCRCSPRTEWQRLGRRGRRPWCSGMRPSIPYGSRAVRPVTTLSMVLRALDVHALQGKYIPAYFLDGWCQSPGQVTQMQVNT